MFPQESGCQILQIKMQGAKVSLNVREKHTTWGRLIGSDYSLFLLTVLHFICQDERLRVGCKGFSDVDFSCPSAGSSKAMGGIGPRDGQVSGPRAMRSWVASVLELIACLSVLCFASGFVFRLFKILVFNEHKEKKRPFVGIQICTL